MRRVRRLAVAGVALVLVGCSGDATQSQAPPTAVATAGSIATPTLAPGAPGATAGSAAAPTQTTVAGAGTVGAVPPTTETAVTATAAVVPTTNVTSATDQSLSVTPVPAPPTPPVATMTPIPAVPLHLSAQLDPPTPHAGEEFTLALTIGNDGNRPTQGVYVATNGPWDQWTVLGVEPSGSFDKDDSGWHVISNLQIPPGETRTIQVHARADQPAQEQLTFAVREATPSELAS